MPFEISSSKKSYFWIRTIVRYSVCYCLRYALYNRAKLKAGETILILGASGGVGSAAIEVSIAHIFLPKVVKK